MKDLIRKCLIIGCLSVLFAIAGYAQTAIKAQVVGIVDGDTVTVLDLKLKRQITIRLAGIDAPEKKQDYGAAAKQKLSDLIFEKKVTILIYKQDRYGRSIGKILLDGRDINLMMVEEGFAWHYKEYENEQSAEDRKLYAAAEINARSAKTALWSLLNSIKPADFRRAAKESSSQSASSAQPSAAPGQSAPGRVVLPVPPTSGMNSGSAESSGATGNGKEKTVHVKGYTRKDGTVVAPYDRSKPNN